MKRLLLVLMLLALVAGACGDDSSVGSGVKIDEEGTPQTRLGETTTTEATTTTTAKPSATTTTAKTATTKPNLPPSKEILIQDDNKGQAFNPSQVQVFQGSVVRWKNTDTKPRSVVSDEGQAISFDSGMIPPGGHWDYLADRAGTINYHDGTRPYAVASLFVEAR